MSSTSVKEEQSLSYLGVLIPLNHLTDPTTGEIIVSAVPQEMQTFAEAYNRMLGTLRRVVQIAKQGLES
ncbi:hypothetical protein PISMIDRAFT_19599 [Pisolithus microcarpus 441]|uniref:Uncharacterized protein n=1 Tax=Pisolithus microcarpus 441 TaxID=765257 RepID=A0A0C9YBJ1_9AGAM|nr:hypothetical protein BKA83DRAFT_19599 [Pisolithus microcarpus]KIK11339.1 hypothetical protein PISMIDRAFT_19599 [Pisolithus microcarpus 441]